VDQTREIAPQENLNQGSEMMKAVMDTNVLVAAFRSRTGASFEVFRHLRLGLWTAVLSNHLLFEYEEILKGEAPTLNLSLSDVDQLLNAICARSEEWLLSHSWRPILTDPDDEPLVQLAIESGARLITTHNVGHLFPAKQLNIEILKPADFLARIRAQ
jgi:predicted nucleic acid-binding protein